MCRECCIPWVDLWNTCITWVWRTRDEKYPRRVSRKGHEEPIHTENVGFIFISWISFHATNQFISPVLFNYSLHTEYIKRVLYLSRGLRLIPSYVAVWNRSVQVILPHETYWACVKQLYSLEKQLYSETAFQSREYPSLENTKLARLLAGKYPVQLIIMAPVNQTMWILQY